MGKAGDPADYDAVIIGSAAYFFRWMKEAKSFVLRYTGPLANRPVWLFSSGPLGNKTQDDQGRELCEVLVPKEIAEFRETVKLQGHRVFFGAFDSKRLSFWHKLVYKLPANKENALFPPGDFRNWSEIDAWATTIAQALKTVSSPT